MFTSNLVQQNNNPLSSKSSQPFANLINGGQTYTQAPKTTPTVSIYNPTSNQTQPKPVNQLTTQAKPIITNSPLVGANTGALGAALNTPTQASSITPGSTFTDTQGNQGTALYNPMTGQPYSSGTTNNQSTAPTNPVQSPYAAAVSNVGNVANQGANNITNAAYNNSTYGPATTGAINGLFGTATNAQNIAQTAGNQISQIGQETAGTAGGYTTGGLISPQALGGAAVQQQTGAAQQQAIAAGANLALSGNSQAQTAYNNAGGLGFTGQGQQIGASGTAASNALTGATSQAGATAPILGAYGQNNYGIGGNSGGTGVSPSDPFYSTLQQYATMAANGQYNAIPTSITSNPVLSAQINSMATSQNPNYNPISSSTIGSTNAAIGSAAQTQAASLGTALTALQGIGTNAVNFLQSNNMLNPTNIPAQNSNISTYIANLGNPALAKSWALIDGDIKNQQSAILASYGSQTPTGVTAQVLNTDPGDLNAGQLSSFLQQLTQLGNIQHTALQTTAQGAYGGSSGYSGTPTTANTSAQTVQNSNPLAGQTQPVGAENAAGFLMGIPGDISGFFGSIFSKL